MENNLFTLLESIKVLTKNEAQFESILKQKNAVKAFDETTKSFIFFVSASLMSSSQARLFPELIALAYWMRKANITRLEDNFFKDDDYRVPTGLVLHFAPSNVDTIFVYSLFLSLLAGNSNIVRVSEKQSSQKTILISLINDALNKHKFARIKTQLIIISYPHSDSLSSYLSANIDMRVIWGGDEAINRISSYPLAPSATELKFTDKYSLCLMNAPKLEKLTITEYESLVKHFVNDSFSFAQQGCSSARTIIWLLGKEFQEQINKFWQAVNEQAEADFAHDITQSDMMNKLVATQLAASKLKGAKIQQASGVLTRLELLQIDQHNSIRDLHCGAGLFFEIHIEKLTELDALIDRKTQTVSYFGFSASDLKAQLIEANLFPDRVIPLGSTLDFSIKWDGFDLLNSMTRIVDFL